MNVPTPGWTGLQRHQGPDFLQWLQDGQALQTGFGALANALQVLLEDRVRTREDVLDLWAAVPAVVSQCNEPDTYRMPGAAPTYAWLHLPDRYVRTWLALQLLVKQCLLPMGREGVRTLDVGTGPGPSAFATHDFYAAMVKYAEVSKNERWRQPARLTCIESTGAMNHFRHLLAEFLFAQGTPKGVLDMCGHIPDFQSIHPSRERAELNEQLRKTYDDYYDERLDEWDSTPCYTPEEANYIANTYHRYRLFTFSNFLTELSTVSYFRANLIDILSDARPGSVLLVIGGTGHDYPDIYGEMAALARDAGFSRRVEHMSVSCSDAEMGDIVYTEGARFYRRLKHIAGDLPDDHPITKEVKAHFEGEKRIAPRSSAIRAYRKGRR